MNKEVKRLRLIWGIKSRFICLQVNYITIEATSSSDAAEKRILNWSYDVSFPTITCRLQ